MLCLFLVSFTPPLSAQDHSVARQWSEVQLDAIRLDVPRPTVHARNLFHLSSVMYDAWAVYDGTASTYLLGNSFAGHSCSFEGIDMSTDTEADRETAISYAAYQLLSHRFASSPGASESLAMFDALMDELGYDTAIASTDYQMGGAAELGNYIAECMITAGLQDGANEANDYATISYEPLNNPLIVGLAGNPELTDMNRWQPLVREFTLDGNGEVVPGPTPGFLSPEWGQVTPFALSTEDLDIVQRDGLDYWVYHDPGPPSLWEEGGAGTTDDYLWNFMVVAMWSSHLDPSDGVMWDISPKSQGNTPVSAWPTTPEEYRAFYDINNGGITATTGHAMNPHTGMPYEEQMVPRGDYGRVLAEFWADGPSSETPPGHWYTLLHGVSDHEALEKKIGGQGEELGDLEWDVKSYLALGAALHDVAVSVWGVKPYYDFIRPVSAIRALAARGQSTDSTAANYTPDGITLVEGYIEVVESGDPLAGDADENVGKIKLLAWKGPDYIEDAETSSAGVDWILAENWWPYQQPSFITPPFAGYVSGHSTFSSAAAEVLTLFTGDEYFPGGMGEFQFNQDEYLIFENGPSVDITLQWARYRDASDEASLSRIWGGIHPPIDDIPGRRMGIAIAQDAYDQATQLFEGVATSTEDLPRFERGEIASVYPNPVGSSRKVHIALDQEVLGAEVYVYNILGQEVFSTSYSGYQQLLELNVREFKPGVYLVRVEQNGASSVKTVTIL